MWGPAWIGVRWNSIWLRARSHMTSHYMSLEVCWDGLWALSFGLSQFHGHGSWLVCDVALNSYGGVKPSSRGFVTREKVALFFVHSTVLARYYLNLRCCFLLSSATDIIVIQAHIRSVVWHFGTRHFLCRVGTVVHSLSASLCGHLIAVAGR